MWLYDVYTSMKSNNLSFREYLEYEQAKPDFLSQLQDELGIPPETFKDVPQILANFAIGDDAYNMGAYEIVGFEREGGSPDGNITHVRFRLMDDPADVTQKRTGKTADNRWVRKKAHLNPDTKIHMISVDQLNNDMLTQGMDQQPGGMGM